MQQNNIRIVRKKSKKKFNYKIEYIIIFKKKLRHIKNRDARSVNVYNQHQHLKGKSITKKTDHLLELKKTIHKYQLIKNNNIENIN